MKQVLIFHTGEMTCSEAPSYPGSLCQFVRTKAFGTKFECALYYEDLFAADGWLLRCQECLEQFRGVTEWAGPRTRVE